MPLVSVSLLGQIALDCFMSRLCGGYYQPSIRFSYPQVIVPFVCFSDIQYLFTIHLLFFAVSNTRSVGFRYSDNVYRHAVLYRKAMLFGM